MRKLLVIILGVLWQMSISQSQYAYRPRIACPGLFEYLDTREGTVGRVTIGNIQPGNHNLQVSLSQTPPTNSISASKISTFESRKSVLARLQRGEPITFRIDFPDSGVLPKVTRITFDGVLLCSDSEYRTPRSYIDLTYDLIYSESIHRNSFPLALNQRDAFYPSSRAQVPAQAQSTPSSACPANIFEYIQTGAGTAGKVTIGSVAPGIHILTVGLSQTPGSNAISASQITSYHSNADLIARLERRQPIMFRVDFPNPYALTKVTRIAIDDQVLCADSEFPPPRSSVRLTYTLTYTSSNAFAPQPAAIVPKASAEYPSCANRLQFLGGDGYITVTDLQPGTTNVIRVKFSHTPAIQPLSQASLSVVHSNSVTADRIERGEPIVFRVRSEGPSVASKVTLLVVNNRIHCSDSDYPPPSTSMELTYKLSHTRGRTVSVPPIPSGADPQITPIIPSRTPPTPTPAPAPAPPTFECGVESADDFTERWTSLIVNGDEVEEGRFPWLVAVNHEQNGRWVPKCGGSLISPRAVVTAAHCLRDPHSNSVKVGAFLGRHNIMKDHEPYGSYIPTAAVYLHPDFTKNEFSDADIGVILLSQSVRISSRINTICLWPPQAGVALPEGSEGTVVGWGITEKNVKSPVPRMATLPMFSQRKCRSPEYSDIVSHRTICGGRRDGSGPCHGDSGGPLMLQLNRKWMLRGIVSTTLRKNGVCSPTSYTVFCDVAHHMDWIRSLDVL